MVFITELNKEKYTRFIENGLVLVDIWAPWCGPCKMLSPIIDRISVEFKDDLSIGKLNADDNRDVVTELGIRSLPTILIYNNGNIVEKLIGLKTEEELSNIIRKYI